MLSATLILTILEYICKSFYMHNSICLYKTLIDCLNIMQIIAKIKNLKEFDSLVFFILIASIALTISKIIIFFDSLDKKITLAIYLQNLFFKHIKSNGKKLIKTFTLILKPNTKAKYIRNFCNSDIKI